MSIQFEKFFVGLLYDTVNCVLCLWALDFSFLPTKSGWLKYKKSRQSSYIRKKVLPYISITSYCPQAAATDWKV